MSNFSDIYQNIPIEALVQQSSDTNELIVKRILGKGEVRNLDDFAGLISPLAGGYLEELAYHSNKITKNHYP